MSEVPISSGSKKASVTVIILLIIFLIGYAIFIFYEYKHKKFIFSPYVPPPLPNNMFEPMGQSVPLTPQQISDRKAAYLRDPNSTQVQYKQSCSTVTDCQASQYPYCTNNQCVDYT